MFFFFLPFRMNYETKRYPVVTITLIGINTLVYLISLICFFATGGDSEDWIQQNLWLVTGQLHWWMFLTHMFVHAGIFHLAGNMIFLFLFGCCVEDMVGRWQFILMYLAGGLVAAFSYIAVSPAHFSSMVPMGGASGAISACMGMYLLLRADAQIEFKYFFVSFIIVLVFRGGEFEVPAWLAIVGWFLRDAFGMTMAMVAPSSHGGVAYGAHVGGLLAGCAMIGIYKMATRSQKKEEELPVSPFESLRRQIVPAMAPRQIEEAPTIYLAQDGQQTGPYTVSQVHSMLQMGSIGEEAVYWTEGMADWQSLSVFTG
ncbi:MAG TPA: rhomboid family intramembrane serine protease [Verrucomicrobiae bacterium]|jgi:membrane associated rhomboid family serine protease